MHVVNVLSCQPDEVLERGAFRSAALELTERLDASDIACFPQGPTAAHQLRNDARDPARLIIFSTPTHRPMSAFYPDEWTVQIQVADDEGFLFRLEDQIEDYWDGEPGADT